LQSPPETVDPSIQCASRHLDAGERDVIALASSIKPPVPAVLDDVRQAGELHLNLIFLFLASSDFYLLQRNDTASPT
jgi:hypothetical protein